MNIYDKNHPHNAVVCEMLQAVIDGTPKTVQYRRYDADQWGDLDKEQTGITLASWNKYQFYRLKPREPVMITRTVTYPAPMAVEPALDAEYFLCTPSGISAHSWCGGTTNKDWLAAGICHLTHEAAQQQWDALFGAQE